MLKHTGTQHLYTDRLIMRKFEYSDNDSMLKNWINDPKVQSLYSEPTYSTKEAVKELLDKYISSYSENNYYRWAIISKETMECIGQIAYFLVSDANHFAELEYCIGSDFQNFGFATEATMSVIEFGFHEVNFHKVQICHKSINTPSKRVIEKCGLTYEGTLRDFFFENGTYIDRLYYSIIRSEFERMHQNWMCNKLITTAGNGLVPRPSRKRYEQMNTCI